jgi:hypothetical protein
MIGTFSGLSIIPASVRKSGGVKSLNGRAILGLERQMNPAFVLL